MTRRVIGDFCFDRIRKFIFNRDDRDHLSVCIQLRIEFALQTSADSSPQGEPLSIITFEKSRKQLIALQVEIRSRYFGNRPNKDFYVALHNKK